MAKILNFLRVIRNNWKKTAVGSAALSYGISYSKDLYETEQLMREYCEKVKGQGDAALPTSIKPRHVTVILNPAAKKKKAKKLFERYCEPLLHLAGIAVNIIQTESGSHARNIIMNLTSPTDAIIIAGGDGTLSDVLTGLMRKYQTNISSVRQCPIGILPLGEVNSIANTLYRNRTKLRDIKEMADATMAIINGTTKLIDSIEIEVIENDPEEPSKPIYAMSSIQWGVWKDAEAAAKKYWYWGPLKQYMTFVFNGCNNKLNWDCTATVKYTEPCDGCSTCYKKELIEHTHLNKRWWHAFVPRMNAFPKGNHVDYSKVVNENCSVVHEAPVSTTELHIDTPNMINSSPPKSLKLYSAPKDIDFLSFVSQGWKHETGIKALDNKILEAKQIELVPQEINPDRVMYVDNEGYELKAVKIKLLPDSVKIFCPDTGS